MSVLGKRTVHSSPCVGICSATALGDSICKGCGRTAEEVRDWNGYDKETKERINKRLSLRTTREDHMLNLKMSHQDVHKKLPDVCLLGGYDTPLLYRPHRGSLDVAMAEVQVITDMESLRVAVNLNSPWPIDLLKCKPYGYDERIGWVTYIWQGRIDGSESLSVIGFTNGPVDV